jgi:hypothetical protein
MLDPKVGHQTGQKILQGIKDVEIDPTEADILIQHDTPLELSTEQRAVVVETLRKSRAKYLVAKKEKQTKRAAKKAPVTEVEGVNIEDLMKLNLDDLMKPDES